MKAILRLRPRFGILNKQQRFTYRFHSTSALVAQTWSTPLAERLAKAITTTGPIPLASYMRQCLTSEDGYYARKNDRGTDPFGAAGDFVTAPEISQVFGELLVVWTVLEWLAQGSRHRGTQLIELGPGRGTLMADFLRAARSFDSFYGSIETIYLLESSPSLREKQRALLCGANEFVGGGSSKLPLQSKTADESFPKKVIWLDSFDDLPTFTENNTPFFFAHEFFDALPIHAFESVPKSTIARTAKPSSYSTITSSTVSQGSTRPLTSELASRNEWRELLVSARSRLTTNTNNLTADAHAEFELTRSAGPTAHSSYLPTLSPRYKALAPLPNAIIEISPESLAIAAKIAQHIGNRKTPSGGALIVDYGPADTVPANSLRGIRRHELVSPFATPGDTDLSASVDFTGLAHAALEASPAVDVCGPSPQWFFLQQLGIEARGKALEDTVGDDEVAKKRIREGWSRLVDRSVRGMGVLYNALAIVPEGRGKEGIVGFGGDGSEIDYDREKS